MNNILTDATKETVSAFGDDGKITGVPGIAGKNKRFCQRRMCEMNKKKLRPSWQHFWLQRTRAGMQGSGAGSSRERWTSRSPFCREWLLSGPCASIPARDRGEEGSGVEILPGAPGSAEPPIPLSAGSDSCPDAPVRASQPGIAEREAQGLGHCLELRECWTSRSSFRRERLLSGSCVSIPARDSGMGGSGVGTLPGAPGNSEPPCSNAEQVWAIVTYLRSTP